MEIGDIELVLNLPAPLDKCPNCGEELILVECDNHIIFHRSQLTALLGDKVLAIKNKIANACPAEIKL